MFIVIAMPHTAISDINIRMPNKSLSGKSNKKPASAMGVQRTKKDHVKMAAIPPVNKLNS